MFLWLKILGVQDTRQFVHSRCLGKLLILAPGYAFSADVKSPSSYIRISYSIATAKDVDQVSIILFLFLIIYIIFLNTYYTVRLSEPSINDYNNHFINVTFHFVY